MNDNQQIVDKAERQWVKAEAEVYRALRDLADAATVLGELIDTDPNYISDIDALEDKLAHYIDYEFMIAVDEASDQASEVQE